MIHIRQAVYEDIPCIMKFIDEHWKKDHIMARDRKMFEFQHLGPNNEVYYILAEDDVDKTLYGTMGYIPMSDQEWACMSTCMICSLKNPEGRMLGEEMSRYFEQNMKCYNVISVGIKERYAKVIQKINEDNIGLLEHYYRLNNLQDFKVAKITDNRRLTVNGKAKLIPLTDMNTFISSMDWDILNEDYPRRGRNYIKHRYYEHPYYDYLVYGVKNQRYLCEAAFVAREESVDDVKVLRIVDWFGKRETIADCGMAIDQLLLDNNYEYIDFYCYGMPHAAMEKGGFIKISEDDSNIIPNYFHPFECKNIKLYFYTWYKEKIAVFRGYGDQDRPN